MAVAEATVAVEEALMVMATVVATVVAGMEKVEQAAAAVAMVDKEA